MCLSNRRDVYYPEIKGWKVFSEKVIEGSTKLYSAFFSAYLNSGETFLGEAIKKYPEYETNKRISVFPESNTFFAFDQIGPARKIALHPEDWNLFYGNLIVLPVTMYNVVSEGSFKIPSGDTQIMDGSHRALECKEIVVHDSPEIRKHVNLMTVQWHFLRNKYSYLEKQAFNSLIGDDVFHNIIFSRDASNTTTHPPVPSLT